MDSDDKIVSGLRHSRDRAVGRHLVVAKRREGWRLGYQVPHYGGAGWQPSQDPDHVRVPIGWDVAEWIGEPIAGLDDAVDSASALRARVLDRIESAFEPDALLPMVLDLGPSAAVVV